MTENRNRLPYTMGEAKTEVRDVIILGGKVWRAVKFTPIDIAPGKVRLVIDLEQVRP